MAGFERQGRIFEEIQRLQAELDACLSGSPDYLPLLRKLNAALWEYNAVPSDKGFQKKISARPDHLRILEPSAEVTEEINALCQERQKFPHSSPAGALPAGCAFGFAGSSGSRPPFCA